VRDYAAEKGLEAEEALEAGMDEKSRQFLEEGAAIYHKI
jgi:phosphomethylpyrimidine synthase